MIRKLELNTIALGNYCEKNILELVYDENRKRLKQAILKCEQINDGKSKSGDKKYFTPQEIIGFIANGQIDFEKAAKASIFTETGTSEQGIAVRRFYLNDVHIGYCKTEDASSEWIESGIEINFNSREYIWADK